MYWGNVNWYNELKMVVEVTGNLKEIVGLCKQMQLQSLFLFGSACNPGAFNKESDLDFLYQFRKDENGMPVSGCDYFDLQFGLEKITGKKIDLVAEEKIKNKFFLERVNKEKVSIYEA